MEDVKICYNYMDVWVYSDNDAVAPWYFNIPREKLPQHPKDWFDWFAKHDQGRHTDWTPFSRVVMTLRTHKDRRRVLDRVTINLN